MEAECLPALPRGLTIDEGDGDREMEEDGRQAVFRNTK